MNYLFPFELVAMSACSTNRAKFGEITILAQIDKVYEDQELEARLFLPVIDMSDLDFSLFPQKHCRIDSYGRRYIEMDLSDSGLGELSQEINETLKDHAPAIVERAKENGSLLVHDPEIDDYRPLHELDRAVSVVDLRQHFQVLEAA